MVSANLDVHDIVTYRIPQLPLKQELEAPPTLKDTIEELAYLQCHRAAGDVGIPIEIWKYGGPTFYVKLHNLLVGCWL